MALVANKIGSALFCQCRNVVNGRGLCQFNRRDPSHQPALVGRKACRHITLAIIVATAHQVPITYQSLYRTTIEIGHTKAMGIFMTDSAEGGMVCSGTKFV